MSRRDLEQWVEHNRARLAADGVTVWLGTTMRSGAGPGPTWVSFVSRTVSARLVCAADGSCVADAHRLRDGAKLACERGPTTTVEDLDALVSIVTDEAPTRR